LEKKGKLWADVRDGQLVGVGKDVGANASLPHGGLKLDHRFNRQEDVAKEVAELAQPPRKPVAAQTSR